MLGTSWDIRRFDFDLQLIVWTDHSHVTSLFSYPTWRKWQILVIMFIIQISINLNASLYANGVVSLLQHPFNFSRLMRTVPLVNRWRSQ